MLMFYKFIHLTRQATAGKKIKRRQKKKAASVNTPKVSTRQHKFSKFVFIKQEAKAHAAIAVIAIALLCVLYVFSVTINC